MPRRPPAPAAGRHPRGRAPRNTLSRQTIVDAALALIDTDGLDAVTMPKLARQLGVGTMSLYRHVDDKDDLIEAAAERVMRGIRVPDGAPDDWRGRVIGYLRAFRDAAIAHPALGRILADRVSRWVPSSINSRSSMASSPVPDSPTPTPCAPSTRCSPTSSDSSSGNCPAPTSNPPPPTRRRGTTPSTPSTPTPTRTPRIPPNLDHRVARAVRVRTQPPGRVAPPRNDLTLSARCARIQDDAGGPI